MKRQNVVFIVMDSLRKDYIQPYNSDIGFTENIAGLADDSTVYDNAVASAPWTLPSHATFFTGMYPWEHGATQKNLNLNVEENLLAELFEEEGYRTGCFSTNAWLSTRFGLTDGFENVENFESSGISGKLSGIRRDLDDWLSSPGLETLKRAIVRSGNYLFHYWLGGSRTEEIIDECKQFIEEGEKPFFLFMNLMDAHEPYFPPKKYRNTHNAKHPRSVCQNPTDFYSGRENADFAEVSRLYSASIDFMDDQIGRMIDYLKNNNYWDETIVVLISDHGQMLGEDGHYGHQYSVSEELVSVPMIVNGVGKENVERQVELRELYEILPSISGLVEEDYEAGMKYALGGYEFPDLQRPRIPENRWDDLYRRHEFSRTVEGKAVKTEKENSQVETQIQSFVDELPEKVRKRLEEKLGEIRKSEKGKDLQEKEQKIRDRLNKLGYG